MTSWIQHYQNKMGGEEAVVYFLPRKADGETVPLLRATMTLMPVSTNGTEKSMISERSSLIVREPMAMSARLYTTWESKDTSSKTEHRVKQSDTLTVGSCVKKNLPCKLIFAEKRANSEFLEHHVNMEATKEQTLCALQ